MENREDQILDLMEQIKNGASLSDVIFLLDQQSKKLLDEIERLKSELKDKERINEQQQKMNDESLINFHIEVMKLGLINEGGRKWDEGYEPKIRQQAIDYLTNQNK